MKSTYTAEYQKMLAKIVAARKAAGVTQAMLAQRIGRPQSFISKIENGERRLDLIEFLEITRQIGLSPSEVLEDGQIGINK
jgi:transcriptional regulator with XRE-family HTH domain